MEGESGFLSSTYNINLKKKGGKEGRARDEAQLEECFTQHYTQGWDPNVTETGMVAKTCNPSTQEVKTRGSEAQGNLSYAA